MAGRLSLLLGALLLAACPARAQAPGTYGQANSLTNCKTSPATVTITVPAGQLVVVWATAASITASLTLSDSANQTYTVAAGPTLDGGFVTESEVAYVAGSAALTSVKLKTSTSVGCELLVAAYSGMATSGVLDVASIQDQTTASATCSSPSITTTNANDVVVGFCGVNDLGLTWTAGGTGCTSTLGVAQTTKAPSAALQDCNATSTGSFQAQFGTAISDTYVVAIAAFKRAAAACTPTGMLMGVERC